MKESAIIVTDDVRLSSRTLVVHGKERYIICYPLTSFAEMRSVLIISQFFIMLPNSCLEMFSFFKTAITNDAVNIELYNSGVRVFAADSIEKANIENDIIRTKSTNLV